MIFLHVLPTCLGCNCGDATPSTLLGLGTLYIHVSRSANGKWRNTFLATFNFSAHLYISSPQCTQWSTFACIPLNNIYPLMQALITSYANPNFFNMCEASYSELGDVLGVGTMLFLNNFNNSLKKHWMCHVFNNNSKN